MGYTTLCRAYNDTTQYQVAAEQCKKALQLNAGDGESNLYLARSYDFQRMNSLATEHYKKAVAGLQEYTRNNSENSDGYYLLGNAFSAANDQPNAISAYKRSLELNPRFEKAIFNLAYVYHASGDKTSADAQYNALLKINPELAGKLKAAMTQK